MSKKASVESLLLDDDSDSDSSSESGNEGQTLTQLTQQQSIVRPSGGSSKKTGRSNMNLEKTNAQDYIDKSREIVSFVNKVLIWAKRRLIPDKWQKIIQLTKRFGYDNLPKPNEEMSLKLAEHLIGHYKEFVEHYTKIAGTGFFDTIRDKRQQIMQQQQKAKQARQQKGSSSSNNDDNMDLETLTSRDLKRQRSPDLIGDVINLQNESLYGRKEVMLKVNNMKDQKTMKRVLSGEYREFKQEMRHRKDSPVYGLQLCYEKLRQASKRYGLRYHNSGKDEVARVCSLLSHAVEYFIAHLLEDLMQLSDIPRSNSERTRLIQYHHPQSSSVNYFYRKHVITKQLVCHYIRLQKTSMIRHLDMLAFSKLHFPPRTMGFNSRPQIGSPNMMNNDNDERSNNNSTQAK